MDNKRDEIQNDVEQFDSAEPAAGEPVNADDDQTEAPNELQELRAEVERLQTESAENLQNFQRAVADLQNYRRRKDQETQRQTERARSDVLLRILPVVDDFRRALQATAAESGLDNWVEGLSMIERKLWNALQSEGVTAMEALGQPFDPSLHEAVMVDENVDHPDTVVEEFQRGYYLHDQVLRPAMVKVGSANELATSQHRSHDQ